VLSRIHELTVSAWVYLTANPAGNRLFDFGGSATSGVYFTFNNGASGTELGLRSASGTRTLVTDTQLPLNVWKHVAVTMSSSGTVMYVDGGVVARSTTLVIDPAAIWPTTNLIGASLTPGEPALAGRIDEFYIYRRVLTLNEIRQLAELLSGQQIDPALGARPVRVPELRRAWETLRAAFPTGPVPAPLAGSASHPRPGGGEAPGPSAAWPARWEAGSGPAEARCTR
jgi:hypothetical protein